MQWNVFPVLLVTALVPLAGCLGGDDGPDDDTDDGAGGRSAVAPGPFYSGVPYDPGLFDLDDLSQPVYDPLPVEEIWVVMADGKRIHNAVYRPETDEPVPVWINFSPYWGDTAETGGDGFSQYLIDNFVPRGYAVVLSAVRGTGHSEGCFQIGGDLELRDSHDVIDFFADEDWSTGKIGAGGKSYDSTTQNGVIAKYPHPALKTLFHVSGITDMYRYNYRYGYPTAQGTVFNTYYYAQGTDEYGASLVGAGGAADEDPESIARLADDVACPELPQMQASGIGSGLTGLRDAYWVEREWTRTIGGSDWDGSIFFYHGFQDWNVKPDNILPWLENLPEQVTTKVWLHQNTFNTGHVYPMRTDWNLTMLRWMDHFLKGIDTGILDEPLVELEGSDGIWRVEDAYPPTRAEWIDLPIASATSLGGAPEVWEVVVAEATDASGPLRYSGAPTVTVTATSVSPDPAFVAVLYDVGSDGTRTWANEAVLRGMYRDSLESPSPVTPGAATEYTLEFYPQDDVLLPGHKWILAVGDAPSQSTNLGTLVDPTAGSFLAGQATVTYDLAGSFLSLPLVLADQESAVQPTAMECIAC